LEKKSGWNGPFRASFRGNRTRPKRLTLWSETVSVMLLNTEILDQQ
jgi:hypothetical protein